MGETSGTIRFEVEARAQPTGWVSEIQTIEFITAKLREKYPEAEIVVSIKML